MSYLGLTRPICRYYLSQIDFPKVLEIGIDMGQTAVPLIQNLSLTKERFMYAGIDIHIRKEFAEQLGQFEGITFAYAGEDLNDRAVILFEQNSLEWLGQNKELEIEFDLVLIDGDHNYHTVINELNLVQNLIKPTTLIVCDDYSGRHGDKDMFYSEREGYENNKKASPRIQYEKEGVRNAVIDFIKSQVSTNWNIDAFEQGPCFLYNEDFLKVEYKSSFIPGQLMRDAKIDFNF